MSPTELASTMPRDGDRVWDAARERRVLEGAVHSLRRRTRRKYVAEAIVAAVALGFLVRGIAGAGSHRGAREEAASEAALETSRVRAHAPPPSVAESRGTTGGDAGTSGVAGTTGPGTRLRGSTGLGGNAGTS